MMSSDHKNLIFLVQSLEQPRVIKRIIGESRNRKVKVFAFRRELHQVENYSLFDGYPNIDCKIIGTVQDRKIFSRFFLYLKLIYLVNLHSPFKRKEIYSFGLDLRIMAAFVFFGTCTYEISDIVWLYRTGIKRKIFSKIDFYFCKRSETVIFTSKAFYEKYYSFLKLSQIKIRENRFKTYGKVFPIENLKVDRIRLAYIGAFRYENIIKSLLNVSSKKSNIDLNFYGDGPEGIVSIIKSYAEDFPNIFYRGSFKNPDDLEEIYRGNNINFVVYDNNLENEQVAMPNKFYESGFFNIPIVCSTKTFVGQQVLKLGMGWTINPTEQDIDDFLKSISIKEVINVHEDIKKLDKNFFEEK